MLHIYVTEKMLGKQETVINARTYTLAHSSSWAGLTEVSHATCVPTQGGSCLDQLMLVCEAPPANSLTTLPPE